MVIDLCSYYNKKDWMEIISFFLNGHKKMVKNWDIAVVVLSMIIGFAIVLMNFTGMWPCNIIQMLNNSPFTGYVNSKELLSNTIGDIHYWLTYPFQCN